MISHKYRVIYIRIPKTASSSMIAYFQRYMKGSDPPYFFNSTDLRLQRAMIINLYHRYFTCAFVRNPFDRFVSIWLHRGDPLRTGEYDHPVMQHKNLYGYAELVKDLFAHSFDNPNQKIGPYQIPLSMLKFEIGHCKGQKGYLLDYNPDYYVGVKRINNAPCSFIGRFENLTEDFRILLDILGAPQHPLPSYNLSNVRSSAGRQKHYSDYYDKATRRLVEDLYAEDLDALGYEFEDLSTKTIPNPLYDMEVMAKRYRESKFSFIEWIKLYAIGLITICRICLSKKDRPIFKKAILSLIVWPNPLLSSWHDIYHKIRRRHH